MRRDVVFVHVPKTGGTSVREALEQALSDRLVLRDYGAEPETTRELYDLVYVQGRLGEFREHFGRRNRGILLSGHFPAISSGNSISRGAARYWSAFHAASFVTFLRHPVDRVYSEYAHFVNLRGWNDGFEKFVTGGRRCQRISLFLSDIDFDSFGFIGFMEDFEVSFAALGRYIGADLPWRKSNVGSYDSLDPDVLANEKYRSMVLELSKDDIALYERLRRERAGVFTARGADFSVANGYQGKVRLKEDGTATGWLCNTEREFITEVEIRRNEQPLAILTADRFSPQAKAKGHSRSGMCGFRIDLLEYASRDSGAVFSFRARGVNYELPGSPIRL